MNNDNKDLFEQFKKVSASYNFIKRDAYSLKKEKEGIIMNKKIIATACASLVLVSGIAFAANTVNKNNADRGLGKGIETAVDNGYIAKPEVEISNIADTDVNVKIDDFLMDDTTLSINFILDFDENIKNTIEVQDIVHVELGDLIIRDEENRIIYTNIEQEAFEKYCKENNLDYKYAEFNENYMNCGLNAYIDKNLDNSIQLTYNIYTDSFPKSKKLYVSFETITLHAMPFGQKNEYKLNGDWNVEIDVPENMYNRTNVYYKVVNCDNKDFNIYATIATDTGFEIGIIMPESDKNEPIISKEGTYIENENGDKFNLSLSVSRRVKNKSLDGNKYDYYDTFSMTKYDATDKLKVVLYYYGNPVTINLERAK